MNTNTKMIIVGLVCIVIGVFGGIEYKTWQVSKAAPTGQFGQGGVRGQGGPNPSGGRRFGGPNGGGRPVLGSVVNLDDKSMTIKLNDGSTRIVLFSDSTTYTQSQTVAKTTVKVGDQVGAFGTDNSDGSLTAMSVQLNPMFLGGRAGQPGQVNPSSSPVASPAAK